MVIEIFRREKFAQDCGLTLCLTNHCVDLYGVQTLICHGDTLCIDDVKYNNFAEGASKMATKIVVNACH